MTGTEGHTRRAVLDAVNGLDVALPGAGRTAERWLALHDLAMADVSVARLCEAHLDATAILAEAGARPREGALYGVWASAGPGGREVRLEAGRVSGEKPFCSGIGIVDRALVEVTVDDDGPRQLVDVDATFVRSEDDWRSPSSASTARVEWHHRGLRACHTGRVRWVDVADVDPIGRPGWYLDRVGFWHGACGPAACWAGGAAGLARQLQPGDDPFRLAAAGELAASAWTLRAVLQQAGDEIDRDPESIDTARRRARSVRHAVHELATAMLDRFARAFGPRPLVASPDVAQRVADVEIYLRQHHGDRDLAALARDLWPPVGGTT